MRAPKWAEEGFHGKGIGEDDALEEIPFRKKKRERSLADLSRFCHRHARHVDRYRLRLFDGEYEYAAESCVGSYTVRLVADLRR